MKNATPTKDNNLITQEAGDIKIRLSRKDVFDMALHEAKGGLEQSFVETRQRCTNLKLEVGHALEEIKAEVTALLKRKYKRVSAVLAELGLGDPEVEVHFIVATQAMGRIGQKGEKETRPSFLLQFRPKYERVHYAEFHVGKFRRDYQDDTKSDSAFTARVSAKELGDVAATKRLAEVVASLEQACDQLDYLRSEITAFEKRSVTAKQQLMKKILETSKNGRGILELARTMAKEVDLIPAVRALPADTRTQAKEQR